MRGSVPVNAKIENTSVHCVDEIEGKVNGEQDELSLHCTRLVQYSSVSQNTTHAYYSIDFL